VPLGDGKLLYNVPRCGKKPRAHIHGPGQRSLALWPVRSTWPGAPPVMHGIAAACMSQRSGRAVHEQRVGQRWVTYGLRWRGAGHLQRQAAHGQHLGQRRCRRLKPCTGLLYKDSCPCVVFSTDTMLGASSAGLHSCMHEYGLEHGFVAD
jgi:hypothetical protein